MTRRSALVLCFVILFAVLPTAGLRGQASTRCLTYEPDTVTVTGLLKRLVFPGPPNYESIAEGDREEAEFYLFLEHPVCTSGDSRSPAAYPIARVDTIQLVLDADGYRQLRPFLLKDVTVRGTLMTAHNAHHHAPLLLMVLQKP